MGIGALYIRDHHSLKPMLCGGKQEHGLRPGTENVLGIVGFGAAASERKRDLHVLIEKLTLMRDRLERELLETVSNTIVNGCQTNRVCNTTNLRFDGVDGEALVALLDRAGIRCSQSSACTSGLPEPSYVLRALGLTDEEGHSSIRFSLSNDNSPDEIDIAIEKIQATVAQLRGLRADLQGEAIVTGEISHEI